MPPLRQQKKVFVSRLRYTSDELSRNNKDYYGQQAVKQDIFKGGFLNFGYWGKNFDPEQPITEIQRIRASKNLYRRVTRKLNIQPTDCLLEIGPGLGAGTLLTYQEEQPASIVAIDVTPEQVERAKKRRGLSSYSCTGISFQEGAADSIALPPKSVQGVYSVEAAQHFSDIHAFSKQAYEVLADGGHFAFCAHFATDEESYETLVTENGFVDQGIDQLTPVPYVFESLRIAGFIEIKGEDLSDYVFPGYDAWVRQEMSAGDKNVPAPSTKIGDNYRKGYLRYYLFSAKKPDPLMGEPSQKTVTMPLATHHSKL